jgi:prevent-host-death family protein
MLYYRIVRNGYYVCAGQEAGRKAFGQGPEEQGTGLTRLSTTKAREAFSDIINRVSYRGERIVLERRGKDVVALVPVEDLKLIEEIEDRMDLEEALRRLREEPDTIPWKEVKARFGL